MATTISNKCCIDNREYRNIYWAVNWRHGWVDRSMDTRIEIGTMLHLEAREINRSYSKAAFSKFFSKSPS